ncbi:MAG: FAD-dependent oxidoreductase [Candidatus Magasanikbacteria bacterium]|nr:FAD-dependent oxidoreductase [Candidatus Magasanikbacteria bacterium]
MLQKKNIAVVGAGISGLICAYELQRMGHHVTVFEKEHQVGGRMASRTKNGLTFDIGADHLCNLYDHMKVYCKELRIPFEPMKFVTYAIYKKGALRNPWKVVGNISRLRLMFEYMKISRRKNVHFFDLSSATNFDTVNGYDYLKTHLGRDAAEYWVNPFCSTYQFHGAKEISLGAVRGVMTLLKYRFRDWSLHQTVGGMGMLPNALAKRLDLHLNTPVSLITGGKTVRLSADQAYSFDAAVIASTADSTKQIYANPSNGQNQLLQAVKYTTSISLAFEVDEKKMPDISVVWVPRVESDTVSGFTNQRMKGTHFTSKGKSLLCAWLHEDYAKNIIPLSDKEIYTQTKKELLKYCPWFTNVNELTAFDLQRWPSAMPKFYPGYLGTVKKFLATAQGENNIFFCGDYLNSPWTEGALQCGQRVAKQVVSTFV